MMRTVGFLISRKENEKRRAILPEQVKSISHTTLVAIHHSFDELLFGPFVNGLGCLSQPHKKVWFQCWTIVHILPDFLKYSHSRIVF